MMTTGLSPSQATNLECGGKRSATPLWIGQPDHPKESKAASRRRLPPHSKWHSLRLVLLIVMLVGCNLISQAQTQTPKTRTGAGGTPAVPVATPVARTSPAPSITGTIKGRLVADDGQPFTNANVMVQSLTPTPSAKPSRVDSDGRFVFEDLPPAAYLVIATAPGYIDQSMSVGQQGDWPRHLIGSNVTITMIKGGVITGTVTNAKGEPMTAVPVRALLNGANSLTLTSFFLGGGGADTDDRGIYRIYGLLPGQYLVQAGGKGSFGQFTPSGFDSDVPTYYPSTTRDTAVPVSVRGGDETAGIDIKYRGADGHSISGFVLGDLQAGAVSSAVTIILTHAGSIAPLSIDIAGPSESRRAFSFDGIGDGEYNVLASYFANASENGFVATKRVVVRGGDVTGLELRLESLSSVTGTVTLDPIKPADKCDQRNSQLVETVLNAPLDNKKEGKAQTLVSMLGSGVGTLSDKGEFALRNLEASRYRLEIKLPTESWYVRAINLPGASSAASSPAVRPAQPPTAASSANRNAWPWLLTLKPGEHLSGAAVMIGQDAAGLRGRVTMSGETATIPVGTRVHLWPAESEQIDNLLRYTETLVASDGTFAFTNLAPGRYFMLARVGPAPEPDTPSQPLARDPAARAKLRSEAETSNTIIELKPCQRVVDYALKAGG